MSELIAEQLPLGRRRLPDPGVVELWISDVAAFPLTGDQPPSGRQERRRVLRFRQRFVLRLLLGSYLGLAGKDIRFDYGPAGKPALSADLAPSGLCFNVSHSGDWLAIALARDRAVGVDIERRRELARSAALARRFLAPAEAQFIQELDEPDRSARFLALWSRREALVKAMGASVVASLGDLELDPRSGQARRLPSQWPDGPSWSLSQPALPPALVGAVAVAAPDWTVSTRVLALARP
ncbi:MAG: 4'-phosphopantetheinyl transferase family protein [Wenzhouxiangella sp.]